MDPEDGLLRPMGAVPALPSALTTGTCTNALTGRESLTRLLITFQLFMLIPHCQMAVDAGLSYSIILADARA